jgi:cytochrome c2
MKLIVTALLSIGALPAATIPMDSARGEKLFASQGCIECHRLNGAGGTVASDLGRVLDRGYTPADLVSAMWNHAPTMWASIREKNVKIGDVDQQAAADLFAAFLSARFFEMRGDAARGKRLFAERGCNGCHGLTQSANPNARPVSQWQTLTDPAGLVGAMWNHSTEMGNELTKRHLSWPVMDAQDLSDLLVYLRNAVAPPAAGQPGAAPGFLIAEGEEGGKLFDSKGCAACHKADERVAQLTLTGVAASMWNHVGILHTAPPRIDPQEMRHLLGYYWASHFFDVKGDASHGRRVYAAKHCASCHSGSGPGPVLSAKAGSYSAISMLSVLWRHGPDMLAEMKQRKIQWPSFRAGEMEDLIAFLNEGKTGK